MTGQNGVDRTDLDRLADDGSQHPPKGQPMPQLNAFPQEQPMPPETSIDPSFDNAFADPGNTSTADSAQAIRGCGRQMPITSDANAPAPSAQSTPPTNFVDSSILREIPVGGITPNASGLPTCDPSASTAPTQMRPTAPVDVEPWPRQVEARLSQVLLAMYTRCRAITFFSRPIQFLPHPSDAAPEKERTMSDPMTANHDSGLPPQPACEECRPGRLGMARASTLVGWIPHAIPARKAFAAGPITAPLGSDAFGELVAGLDLLNRLQAVAVTRLAVEDAEEVVSDTLWCLAKRLDRVSEAKPINDVFAFAVKVLRRKIAKVHSKKKRIKVHFVPTAPELLVEVADRVAGSSIRGADRYAEVLAAALDRLTGNVRRVFELVAIEGQKPNAAAVVLGCHAGHVRRLVREARPVVEQLVREICS